MERMGRGRCRGRAAGQVGGELFEEYRARRTSWRPARGTARSDSSWKEGGGEMRWGGRLLRPGAGSRAGLAARASGAGGGGAPPGVGAAGSGTGSGYSCRSVPAGPAVERSRSGFFSPRWGTPGRRSARTRGMRWPGRGDANSGSRVRDAGGDRGAPGSRRTFCRPPRSAGDCRGENAALHRKGARPGQAGESASRRGGGDPLAGRAGARAAPRRGARPAEV